MVHRIRQPWTRERWWAPGFLVIAGVLAGTGCEDPGLLPFARSAPPASLVLNLRLPGPPLDGTGVERRAQILQYPSDIGTILIEIGEAEQPDVSQFFPVQATPGTVQGITISGIPPGLAKRVVIRVFDVTGNAVLSDLEFRVDFFPGKTTTNDPSLAGGVGLAGFSNPTILDDLMYCANFDEAPLSATFSSGSPCASGTGTVPTTESGTGVGGSAALYPGGADMEIAEVIGFRDETVPFQGSKICVEGVMRLAATAATADDYKVGIGFRLQNESGASCGTKIGGTLTNQFDSAIVLHHEFSTNASQVRFFKFMSSTMSEEVGSPIALGDEGFHVYTICVDQDGAIEYSIDGQLVRTAMGQPGGALIPAFIYGEGLEDAGAMNRFVDDFKVFQRFRGLSGPAYQGSLAACE